MSKIPFPDSKQPGATSDGTDAEGKIEGGPKPDADQAQLPQNDGGGGAPGTGAVDVSVPPSPGEGISENDAERSQEKQANSSR